MIIKANGLGKILFAPEVTEATERFVFKKQKKKVNS
jgi:hypothetical protein